jgi:hypothetical protein
MRPFRQLSASVLCLLYLLSLPIDAEPLPLYPASR